MFRALYTALFYLLLPFVLLRTWWRGRANPDYRRHLPERLGAGAPQGPFDLWIHAVSVGETRVAQILLRRLRERHPQWRILLTNMTPTGAAVAREHPELRDAQCHLPWDLPGAVARFLDRSQPRVAVILETEMWPNLFAALRRRGIPLIIANARLSPGSYRNYLRLRGAARKVLSAVDLVAAQTDADAERFVAIGAPAARVQTLGNIKFDLSLPADHGEKLARLVDDTGFAPGPRTLVGASIHPAEDRLLVEVFSRLRQTFKDARLVLVPRHPERFEAMTQTALESGIPVLRRSAKNRRAAPILIGDSLGEMLAYLSLGDVVVIGGSFIEHGGQNPMEAALLGRAVLYGPQMYNFTEPAALLEDAGAAERLDSAERLHDAVARLWQDETERTRRGEAGRTVMAANTGASARLIEMIEQRLPS